MPTILLHALDDGGQDSRLVAAAAVGRCLDAHISCIDARMVDLPVALGGSGGAVGADLMAAMVEEEAAHRSHLEGRLAREGVSWDWRIMDGDIVSCLEKAAQLADAVVLSQPVIDRRHGRQVLPILNEVIERVSVPVLAVPPGLAGFVPGDPALVAWNGSEQAAAALRGAVPFLQRAAVVHLIEVDQADMGFPSVEAVEYLSRHGITAEIHAHVAAKGDVANEILDLADRLSAAYIVMGAYGRSPLRERLLGGVTRAMLSRSPLPLLLAH